jgi:hypothetical protein
LEYTTDIWYFLWPYNNLAEIWYIFPRFGLLCQEKSGNPVDERGNERTLKQGDQIGHIFADRAIVYFWHILFKITDVAQTFRATFKCHPSTKNGLGYILVHFFTHSSGHTSTKNGLGYILVDFFTNSSGRPAQK